jgi:hypothetical protein
VTNEPIDERQLERARAAAVAFARHFGFPASALEQIDGSPIQSPLTIERNGVAVRVYRWLGHGRGANLVQVEVSEDGNAITVYGSLGDRAFGPWTPTTMDEA